VAQLYELYKETNKPLVDSESWWKFKIGHLYINFVIYNFFCEFLTITIWIGLHIHWNTTTSVVPLLTWSPHVRLIEGLNIDQVKPKTIKLAFTVSLLSTQYKRVKAACLPEWTVVSASTIKIQLSMLFYYRADIVSSKLKNCLFLTNIAQFQLKLLNFNKYCSISTKSSTTIAHIFTLK
jgi:hypothetical protein